MNERIIAMLNKLKNAGLCKENTEIKYDNGDAYIANDDLLGIEVGEDGNSCGCSFENRLYIN